MNDLFDIYKDISKNIKNKNQLLEFEKTKLINLNEIKKEIETGNIKDIKYNIFYVKEPKIRIVMSSDIKEKIIDHYITKHILQPKLTKYLQEENFATRKYYGTNKALNKIHKDLEYFKKYNNFYFLKIDIKSYFYTIDHNVLKSLLKNYLTLFEFKLISKIIDATNQEYINKQIKSLNIKEKDKKYYKKEKGLVLGAMSSQFLAIFYLYKIHHYIKHDLKILHFGIYMDDYYLIHQDKEYLKYTLNILELKLKEEYKLKLNNKKTMITNNKEGIIFLNYNFKVINKKTVIKFTNFKKIKLRKNTMKTIKEYKQNKIEFNIYLSKMCNYKYSHKFINKNKINAIINIG